MNPPFPAGAPCTLPTELSLNRKIFSATAKTDSLTRVSRQWNFPGGFSRHWKTALLTSEAYGN
jgi:hypothetical protein